MIPYQFISINPFFRGAKAFLEMYTISFVLYGITGVEENLNTQ